MDTLSDEDGLERWRVLILPVVVGATLFLLYLKDHAASAVSALIRSNPYVDAELKYQLLSLALAGVVLLITFLLGPRHYMKFFRIGRNFLIIISAVTFVLIYMQAIRGNDISPENLRCLPWILVTFTGLFFLYL